MADIKDTEIRFIGDEESFDSTRPISKKKEDMKMLQDILPYPPSMNIPVPRQSSHKWYRKLIKYAVFIIVLAILYFAYTFFFTNSNQPEKAEFNDNVLTKNIEDDGEDISNSMFESAIVEDQKNDQAEGWEKELMDLYQATDTVRQESYCVTKESIINGIPFRIFIPVNATPDFRIGKVVQTDNDVILALQAADIRRDNGKVVGACVNKGTVVSKGLAKKGFVAIINDKITVGVEEHSPLFEEAIDKNGDFFRQYPLVSDGSIVENNPNNLSIRKAICEWKDRIFVIETQMPVSFHDFSQMLVDLDVTNAVYLVGSQYSCGFLRDQQQSTETWGEVRFSRAKNISYIAWTRK